MSLAPPRNASAPVSPLTCGRASAFRNAKRTLGREGVRSAQPAVSTTAAPKVTHTRVRHPLAHGQEKGLSGAYLWKLGGLCASGIATIGAGGDANVARLLLPVNCAGGLATPGMRRLGARDCPGGARGDATKGTLQDLDKARGDAIGGATYEDQPFIELNSEDCAETEASGADKEPGIVVSPVSANIAGAFGNAGVIAGGAADPF